METRIHRHNHVGNAAGGRLRFVRSISRDLSDRGPLFLLLGRRHQKLPTKSFVDHRMFVFVCACVGASCVRVRARIYACACVCVSAVLGQARVHVLQYHGPQFLRRVWLEGV